MIVGMEKRSIERLQELYNKLPGYKPPEPPKVTRKVAPGGAKDPRRRSKEPIDIGRRQHGTYSAYRAGCGCPSCVDGYYERARTWPSHRSNKNRPKP